MPPKYFLNYKELVRKSVPPPNIESLMVPPNLKVAPRSLLVQTRLLALGNVLYAKRPSKTFFQGMITCGSSLEQIPLKCLVHDCFSLWSFPNRFLKSYRIKIVW